MDLSNFADKLQSHLRQLPHSTTTVFPTSSRSLKANPRGVVAGMPSRHNLPIRTPKPPRKREKEQPSAGPSTAATTSASSRSNSNNHFENLDLALARRLQAQFDNEDAGNTYQPATSIGTLPQYTGSTGYSSKPNTSPYDTAGSQSAQKARAPDSTTFVNDPTAYMQSSSGSASQAQGLECTVRNLAQPLVNLKCRRCSKYLLQTEVDIVAASQSILNNEGRLPGIPCFSCRCRNRTEQDHLTMIWILLCGFDAKSTDNKAKYPLKQMTPARKYKATASGTGYGGGSNPGPYYTFGPPSRDDSGLIPKADDQNATDVMTALNTLLPSHEKSTPSNSNPPTAELQSLFLCSSILECAAELLRNNGLEDVTSRASLYRSLVGFVRTLATHSATSALVFGERVARSPGGSLFQVSLGTKKLVETGTADTRQPLTNCITELAAQCNMMLQSKAPGRKDLPLLESIKSLNDFFIASVGPRGKSAPTRPAGKTAWMQGLAVADLPDEKILNRHSLASKEHAGWNVLPGRMKRILQEISRLQTSLPDGIFVRHASSRPDAMKVLMIGPKDTPYENGLFEFDLYCGAQFPTVPPKMILRTTGGGTVNFNPNLYETGKVCLSLLGTWAGEPWKPKQSTLLQVLVSIHAMIFCDEPWYNEPGHERVPNAKELSRGYNRSLYPYTVQFAMLDWLENRRYDPKPHHRMGANYSMAILPAPSTIEPDGGIWDQIVKKHFEASAADILATVGKWVADKPPPLPAVMTMGYNNMFSPPPPASGRADKAAAAPAARTGSRLAGGDLAQKLREALKTLKINGRGATGYSPLAMLQDPLGFPGDGGFPGAGFPGGGFPGAGFPSGGFM